MSGLVLLPIVALPLAGAATVVLVRAPRAWARIAAMAAFGTFVQHVLWALSSGSGVATALAVNAAITTAVVMAAPRRELGQRDLALPLVWLAAGTVVLASDDALEMLVGWLTPPLFVFLSLRAGSSSELAARRVVGAYHLLGSLPLALAVATLAVAAAAAGRDDPFALAGWSPAMLPPWLSTAVFVMVSLSAMARLGVPPFHSWVPVLAHLVPAGPMVALTSVQMSVHVMVRLGLAPLAEVGPTWLVLVRALGVLGAGYAAVMAASQVRLRGLIAYVTVAQCSLLVVGLTTGDLVSVSGALTNAISVALTSRGLMLAARAIEARVGAVDLRDMSGVVHRAPRLAAVLVMLGLAATGLPGSLEFVGEDLLLQALVRDHPWVAVFAVVSMVVSGIALLRGILRTCFGPPPSWSAEVPDLFPRERVLLGLAVGLLMLGLHPQPLIRAHQDDAEALLGATEGTRSSTAAVGGPAHRPPAASIPED